MEFRIADTFTDSLARLTGEEQKAVKVTAFELQINPAHPSLQLHKLDKVKDKRFWSVRAGSDIRLIVHRSENSFLLCYVHHHEQAYRWAEARKLETHPKTGAAQLVVIPQSEQPIALPVAVTAAPQKPLLFAHIPDSELMSFGVPSEWLPQVKAADEDSILLIADLLPAEAAEVLLDLATGKKPQLPVRLPAGGNPFEHPDAQRRFRVMGNAEELERALDFPWEKWTVFLHPAQRQLVERNYNGPARVAGSAGTGKTIVALHRAAYLARTNPESRVLLTTFSDTLCSSLSTKLRSLVSNEPKLAERIEVHSVNGIGRRLYEANFGKAQIPIPQAIDKLLQEAAKSVEGSKFSLHFLRTEWEQIVDAYQLSSWEAYRDVPRLGRKTRLPEKQRVSLWSIFDRVRSNLAAQKLITWPELFTRVASKLTETGKCPFDFVVVDESQDVSVPQLRFLAVFGAAQPNRLFFAGDLGQRIFQQPFSWKALGVDVRGRSSTLKINYRTSHQIRMQADRLLGPEVSDVDGNKEERKGTISVFNGPPPSIQVLSSAKEESQTVGKWLQERTREGLLPHEIGVFVRSEAELPRAMAAVDQTDIPFKVLDQHVETAPGRVSLSTMHLAKGLEFRAIAVMACDDEILPLQSRIETVSDDSDLEETYNTERHLLYVACTRARDHLLVTGVEPASEFLDDLTNSTSSKAGSAAP